MWLPFIISYLLLLLSLPLLTVTPEAETSHKRRSSESEPQVNVNASPGSQLVPRMLLRAQMDQFSLLRFIFSNRNMQLAGAIFAITTLRRISLCSLIQYASTSFGWKLFRQVGSSLWPARSSAGL